MKHWIRWAAFLSLGMVACAEPPAETPATDEAGVEVTQEDDGDEESQADAYEVRGQIASLPAPGDVQSQFMIRHEAIDDFKGIGGEIWGMDSMTMPFEVADDISFEGLAAGDKIRFTLTVDWFGSPPQEITAIEKLPDDTELDFRPAQPAEAEAGEESEGGEETADDGETAGG